MVIFFMAHGAYLNYNLNIIPKNHIIFSSFMVFHDISVFRIKTFFLYYLTVHDYEDLEIFSSYLLQFSGLINIFFFFLVYFLEYSFDTHILFFCLNSFILNIIFCISRYMICILWYIIIKSKKVSPYTFFNFWFSMIFKIS